MVQGSRSQAALRLSSFLVLIITTQFTASAALGEGAIAFDTFDSGELGPWVHSKDAKYNGQFKVSVAKGWENPGLQIPEKNKHYGIVRMLDTPLDPTAGTIIVQYEVKHADAHTCGGSYIKLLTQEPDSKVVQLNDQTPYSIMFGPDKCGDGKVHLIFRHQSPVNGSIEEKHLQPKPVPPSDTLTHVYTLKLTADNRFEVLVDGESKASGSLLDASKFSPPFNPPEDIPDPEDKKPADWVDEAEIPEPNARKPDSWDDRLMIADMSAKKPKGWLDDEPATIPDPGAVKPEEWSDDEDGAWVPPSIPNPKCKVGCGEWKRPTKANPSYKGMWEPPMVPNPKYKGPWEARKIKNPHYYIEDEPLKNIGLIGAVAIEVWTIDQDYYFDNFLITDNDKVAKEVREKAWRPRFNAEKKAKEAEDKKAAEEAKKKADKKDKKKKKVGGLAGLIIELFNKNPFLKPLKPHVKPMLQQLKKTPELAYLLVTTPALLFLVFLALRPKRKKRSRRGGADHVGYRKKFDLSDDDDDDDVDALLKDEEVKEKQQQAAGGSAGAQPADAGAGAASPDADTDAAGGDEPATAAAAGEGAGAAISGAAGSKQQPQQQHSEIEAVVESDDEEEAAAKSGARRRPRRA